MRSRAAAKLVVTGRAIGERIASGPVRIIGSTRDLAAFQSGDVLVAETTSPDWEPVMKRAGAIVTNRGGRTCHAAIVARELGVPAIVGAGDATGKLSTGALVTVSCAEGEIGRVYPGRSRSRTTVVDLAKLDGRAPPIMVNLGNPDLAFRTAMRPNDGVGLARMEFIISEQIGIHPMALVQPEKVTSAADRDAIAPSTKQPRLAGRVLHRDPGRGRGHDRRRLLSQAGHRAAVGLQDNEYARLIGGANFEPKEENPMIGFRGASRYAHPAYAPASPWNAPPCGGCAR